MMILNIYFKASKTTIPGIPKTPAIKAFIRLICNVNPKIEPKKLKIKRKT